MRAAPAGGVPDDEVGNRGGRGGADAVALEGAQRWYVAQTLPHKESGAEQHLRNQGFATFLPRRQKTRRHARKLDTVLAPFFPRYLFLVMDLTRDRWRSVNGTYGVASLIMGEVAPKPVPAGIVERLRAQADGRGVLRYDPRAALRPGDSVRLLSGPFAEQVGCLERLDDQGRVRVLLEIMSGRVSVDLGGDAVMPA